jgi:hypothetical protein
MYPGELLSIVNTISNTVQVLVLAYLAAKVPKKGDE